MLVSQSHQGNGPANKQGSWTLWKIPPEIIERVGQLPDRESRLRLAGQLAARELQEHPERFASAQGDPIQIWDKLRAEILESFPGTA